MALKLVVDGDIIMNPSWDDVEKGLERLRRDDMQLYLAITPSPDEGPYTLVTTASGDGYYSLELGGNKRGESWPKTYVNPQGEDKLIDIGGYTMHARNLTRDFDLVARAFKEFFETGDVSKDIIS